MQVLQGERLAWFLRELQPALRVLPRDWTGLGTAGCYNLLMHGYRKIRYAKVKAAQRKLRRKQARWGDKIITRGSGKGGDSQCTANQRKHMNVSRMMRKHG